MIYKEVFEKLLKKGLTIGFAESMTGGLCAYKMVENSGASKVLLGSIVAYNNQIKNDILGVDMHLIENHRSVSKEVALSMAKNLKQKMNPDICVSVTGNAGPSFDLGSDHLEAYYTILFKNQIIESHITFDESNRIENILKTVSLIYHKIDEIVV
jgi:nicotinamide-nucleotide amidase